MCGIIGYVGHRPCEAVLLEGLRRLEYRGYDSAGLAWREDGHVERVRAIGSLRALQLALERRNGDGHGGAPTLLHPASPQIGIGHTRWATHGSVTEQNAHPHSDSRGRVWIVLNGIIENYMALRARLERDAITCSSETDAEVLAHLIGQRCDGSLAAAVESSLALLEGQYAFVAMCDDEPDTLIAVRRECPLVVGLGDGEQFVASSIAAFLSHTRDVAVLRDGEIAVVRRDGVKIAGADGRRRPPGRMRVEWEADRMDREGYETFMLKEIHEQPQAIADTLSGFRGGLTAAADGTLADDRLRELRRIVVIACGTSLHAGLAGQLAIERWARVPVEVDVASEFRYRDPIVDPGTLVLGVTQSGETADTLAAMRLARDRGATVVAVTNAHGSQATRDSDAVLFTRAGIELGVAATKTFVAQVALLCALALRIGTARGTIEPAKAVGLERQLRRLPEAVAKVVHDVDADARELAEELAWSPFFLYLGRMAGLPVAMEGALKLKEISYVPTDAYAAGEMKHGPIALLSAQTPVVSVATEESVLPKLVSNLEEVRARGARVIAVAGEGSTEIAAHAERVFYIPRMDPLVSMPLAVIPLQLFAYHVARTRGLNVDQPRNLAKTVTVE